MTNAVASEVVDRIRDQWSTAFNARDFDALVAHYTEDGLFFGSAPELCASHSEIQTYFNNLPLGIALVDFPPMEVRAAAPGVIIASGFWTFDLDGETLDFRLSWTLVEREGRWLIAQHHAGRKPTGRL
jgi:uncharacterized protein (TIGR02246 family)